MKLPEEILNSKNSRHFQQKLNITSQQLLTRRKRFTNIFYEFEI
jgi:hypothetical protein